MVKTDSVLIIGGTGTLGIAIIEYLIHEFHIYNICVVSRDEQKQQKLKHKYSSVKFHIGDIKDKSSIKPYFQGKKLVFHVAALKHIDVVEDNPIESVKTNILGTINVAECCIESEIGHCVFSSTDKAVDSINVYGCSKQISERILIRYNETQNKTQFNVFRWGNIIGSNGSVIPFFIKCLKDKIPVPITDYSMTRFWITIEEAVKFMCETAFHPGNAVKIPTTMKSASVVDIVSVLGEIMKINDWTLKLIGKRKGEKLHEALISRHRDDGVDSSDCDKYSREELIQLLTPLVEKHI